MEEQAGHSTVAATAADVERGTFHLSTRIAGVQMECQEKMGKMQINSRRGPAP
jgi:hypothetical protein